ncbi:hypothetical protein [Streptococcus phage vB_Sags-UPM1]|nr:hypothetical protein C4888_10085 [Streptococcus agalactiae]WFZ87313.1 hypothetical protein [Streptococcus phage vB_Sags-UPM1]HEN0017608.1 hypothetical protein [Streptococcus agalactiae]HEN0023674.1 hypothetical protein [Streptococcus agalactiae]HEN0031510.1 hypothetical protein [Streptococcus agalactiae]
MKILTEFKMEIIEYNKHFPNSITANKTEVVVIADSLRSAIDRAFELTPEKYRYDDDYVMKAKIISLRDILIDSEVANEY